MTMTAKTLTLTVEGPRELPDRLCSPSEANLFLRRWHRVVASDGSTVAYAPDRTTAERIAEALS